MLMSVGTRILRGGNECNGFVFSPMDAPLKPLAGVNFRFVAAARDH